MKTEKIESKDMITFVNRILQKSNHFNTVIRIPERCNGEFIDVEDFDSDNIPTISHKHKDIGSIGSIGIGEYQITINLQKYTVLWKIEHDGYQMMKKYRIRYNGRFESNLSFEDFKELYNSIISKYLDIKKDNQLYYENSDLLIFNSIVK